MEELRLLFLFVLGIIAGMMVPIQTSINSRLGRFTESSFYASTISFFVGTLFLLILNIIFNIQMFSSSFYAGHSIDYHWWVGGLLGVCFLTGNLLLLPRLGAALTVVMTVAGQIIMGVIIDTLGLLGANQTSFTFLKGVGIIVLLFGILVGTIALFILTIIFNRSLKIKLSQHHLGRIKPLYFIGGILGVVFVTSNIILMPYLGAALTTIVAMLGQMIMGVIIDHFGIGVPKNEMTFRKFIGLIAIAIGIKLLSKSSSS